MNRVLAVAIMSVLCIGAIGSGDVNVEKNAPLVVLKDLPECFPITVGNTYRVDPYIAAAEKLQAAGKEKAESVLLDLAKQPDHGEKVIVLCRMLYSAKMRAEFQRPLIGGPFCIGRTGISDWPLEPIEVVEGVPFLVVRGYILAGHAESADHYVRYCIGKCVWRGSGFRALTAAEKQKALKKMQKSQKWKAELNDDDKQFLTSQIK